MPNPTKGPRLGGSPAHQRIILANLASQLFEHGRITTTETKAKRVRPLAEKLITKAKRGDLHNRRLVLATIRNPDVVHVLFTEIAPQLTEREGGYTRITKVGPRKGDNAPMAIIEIVTESVEESRKAKGKAAAKSTKKADKPASKPTAKAATLLQTADDADEATADEESTDAAEAKADDAKADKAKADDAKADKADDAKADKADDAKADDAESKYGEGSYVGDNPPAGYDIKGNADSMKFHTTESPWYDRTIAEVWFNSPEAAEKAGFVPAVAEDDDESTDA